MTSWGPNKITDKKVIFPTGQKRMAEDPENNGGRYNRSGFLCEEATKTTKTAAKGHRGKVQQPPQTYQGSTSRPDS